MRGGRLALRNRMILRGILSVKKGLFYFNLNLK